MAAKPVQHTNAATIAVLVFAGLLSAPILAAPDRGLLCHESADPLVAVTTTELTATPVNSSDELLENHLLKPRAEAAARGAFVNEPPVDDTGTGIERDETGVDEAAVKDPGIHSASEDKSLTYRRRMYRRDI